jgi:hypothetical protein
VSGGLRLSRRALLGAGGTAVGGSLAGCWSDEPAGRTSTVPTVPPAAPEEAAIFDLSFTTESRYRPFELVATEAGTATDVAPGV